MSTYLSNQATTQYCSIAACSILSNTLSTYQLCISHYIVVLYIYTRCTIYIFQSSTQWAQQSNKGLQVTCSSIPMHPFISTDWNNTSYSAFLASITDPQLFTNPGDTLNADGATRVICALRIISMSPVLIFPTPPSPFSTTLETTSHTPFLLNQNPLQDGSCSYWIGNHMNISHAVQRCGISFYRLINHADTGWK